MIRKANKYYESTYLNTSFPEKTQLTDDFKRSCLEIKNSINRLASEDTEKDKSILDYLKENTRDIQLRTIPDEIEEEINRILSSEDKNEYLKYIDPTVLEKAKNLSPTRSTQNRLSRLAGRIKEIPNELKSYHEILSKRKNQNILSSYLLTNLSKNTRLRRQFVSVNSIVFPHYLAKIKFEKKVFALEAHSIDINSELYEDCIEKVRKNDAQMVEDGSVIITVSFYHHVRGMKIAEFDILDSQKLACLRETFKCDDSILEEELLNFSSSGSCFEIGGDLYVDLKNKNSVNYANKLVGFTKKHDKAKVYDMENLKLSQIQIPINNHCTYIHSGDCEHRVTFTNIRMFSPKHDCPYKAAYPIQTYSHSKTFTFCEICGVNQVQKAIFNSINLPRNPSQLCDSCTFAFFYDKETKQLVEKCTIRAINSSHSRQS
ncbi:hypothetical protein FG386_001304 [Cryptosporidium ryanae]|uniref:uncharacterized protein n=1 Tax=Cryptosporidium ryanae TaxID=515981 RepID=UPI00351A55AB|nr:hypothetical protein FG386_001304 [Cryptosporidium ryanae]